jgi:RNA polymerase sigma-70 factor, ECF subfamily
MTETADVTSRAVAAAAYTDAPEGTYSHQMDAFDPVAVEQAQAGDERARARLLARLEPIFRRFFYSRIGARDEVDDLVQNALLRVHNGLDVLQRPDRLKAFAMKAAVFELQDFYRGRYNSRETTYDPDLPPPGSTDPEPSGLRIDLDRAMEALSPKARRIIELRELGYPYKEIADMVDTTEAAVKMQVKRAFERLRSVLTVAAVLFSTLWITGCTL